MDTLTLPSGGTVEFIDIDDLTGGDIQELRRTIKSDDGAGETSNKLLTAAATMAIKTWDVPYLADPRTPQANPAALRKLKARDLIAIERHVAPILAMLVPPAESEIDDTPGSPTLPASD